MELEKFIDDIIDDNKSNLIWSVSNQRKIMWLQLFIGAIFGAIATGVFWIIDRG